MTPSCPPSVQPPHISYSPVMHSSFCLSIIPDFFHSNYNLTFTPYYERNDFSLTFFVFLVIFFPFCARGLSQNTLDFPWLSGLEWVMQHNDSTGSTSTLDVHTRKIAHQWRSLCKVDSDMHAQCAALGNSFFALFLLKKVTFNCKTYFWTCQMYSSKCCFWLTILSLTHTHSLTNGYLGR